MCAHYDSAECYLPAPGSTSCCWQLLHHPLQGSLAVVDNVPHSSIMLAVITFVYLSTSLIAMGFGVHTLACWQSLLSDFLEGQMLSMFWVSTPLPQPGSFLNDVQENEISRCLIK